MLTAAWSREIYELAGREFNIGSPKQLGEVLFHEHKLPMLKRTKTGRSTDADVLEELAAQHPLPAKIIEYRQYCQAARARTSTRCRSSCIPRRAACMLRSTRWWPPRAA